MAGTNMQSMFDAVYAGYAGEGGGGVRGRMMRRRRYVPWGNDDQNCLEDDAK